MLPARDVAALDAAVYVRRVRPFDLLSEPAYLEAARTLEIGIFESGTRLVAAGGAPLRHLYVIRRGAVRLERDRQVLQVLEEGEVFGYTSLISGRATLDVVVEENLLAYLLPAAEFERLLGDARFAAHFAVGLTDRLKASLAHVRVARFEPDVGIEVERLVRRPPAWLAADATVREAARVMRDEHISSVLLRGEPPGIVTDRDLRNRVLGEDLGPEIPAARVCSRPLRTIPAATPLYAAWRTFLDARVNHLPVEREGEIVGVLTSTDLLRHSAQGPVAVLRRFERLTSREALPEYGAKLAEMAAALLAAGLDAPTIALLAAQLDATLLRRLLHLAEADLGPPPAPYAWLVLGAAGRREAVLPAPQDDVLVHADEGAVAAGWYRALAERIVADLAAAGFPAPAPERTAIGRTGTLSAWVRRVEETPETRAWEVAPLLDLRRAAGVLDVSPIFAALARAGRGRLFVRILAKQALAAGPPSTLLLRLRGSASRVHLERDGIQPIVALARCFALEVGSEARGTLGRLDEATQAGAISERTQASVSEAFRFLSTVRLAHGLRAAVAGRVASAEIALAELAGIERTRLKDAFRAVRAWQEAAAFRYQTHLVMPGPAGGERASR